MTPSRLSLTCVRVADDHDRADLEALLPGAGAGEDGAEASLGRAGRVVLVMGQPVVAAAEVIEMATDTQPTGMQLSRLRVLPHLRGRGLRTSLLLAAMGLGLERGLTEMGLGDEVDLPEALPMPLGGEVAPGGRVELLDEPAPRPAVSVLPLRDGPAGLEVFVQHRVSTMDFAAGVVVFPGGRIDPGDAEAGGALDLPDGLVAEHVAAWAGTEHGLIGGGEVAARTLLATGLREVQEETGARVDPSRLVPWDDWITPAGLPRRFDVRFFVLPVSQKESQAYANTTTEAHRSEWVSIASLIRQTEDGTIGLMSPTRALVDELSALGSVEEALAHRPVVKVVRHDTTPRRPRGF
ncbi:NUDIX hydrolase [Ornithinimicrobium panacihumi]|uniref:NUDIX hydrolase n=1 Tax=Ornithinimicrobium panacihumi TaxID=2008449 RepID=UPI003F8B1EC5